MNAERLARLFPLGSHLCREPMPPMSELKRDMENLKHHGFNLIKLQEHWAIDEPQEGRCDFSRYEELIEHAARLDLGIYLGLTCEQAPGWLWRKHPGCRMVGRNGLPVAYEAQTTLPADGKPGPCYDDAGAMADQVRFIQQLVRTLGRYENIVCWNTWQEIGYWPERLAGQPVCYCQNTLAAFRAWLWERYGDLDGLNRAWNTRYLDWESVGPDRLASVRYPQPQNIDWHYFMDNVQVGNVLRARARAIRDADPLGRPIFAHKGAPAIGAGQDWTYARCQDFLASSCYPAWNSLQPWDDGRPAAGEPLPQYESLLAEMVDGVALRFDYIRSCNRHAALSPSKGGNPVWAAEFQGGPVSTGFHKGRVPGPADMRRWMLTAVGAGITALSFWVTRAEIHMAEANGFSLLDSAGDSTPRYEEAARIGSAFGRYPDLFAQPTRPRAQVAILIDEWNYQLTQLMSQGYEHLPYSVRGWYRLLWELNIPVDFVEASELDQAYVSDYRALILPFPLGISDETAGRLARYVEGGGNLISEAAPGRFNLHGYCNRGELSPVMAELFGVAQRSFTMIREPGGQMRWSPPERTWGEYLDATMLEGAGPLAGQRMRANVYIETFDPSTGSGHGPLAEPVEAAAGSGDGPSTGSGRGLAECEAVLRYGDAVAGTVRPVGKGQAWLLGTYVGHNATAYRDTETHAAVRMLLAQCGAHPEHPGQLVLHKRVSASREAWLFTNPTSGDLSESIDVRGYRDVRSLLGEPLERQGDLVVLSVKSLDVVALVLER